MLRNCTLHLEFMLLRWCPGQGSNLHDGITRRGILSPLCLPVSPPGLKAWIVSERNWKRVPSSPLKAGVGIEPASTALQVENASKPNKELRNDSQKNSALRFLMISNNNAV